MKAAGKAQTEGEDFFVGAGAKTKAGKSSKSQRAQQKNTNIEVGFRAHAIEHFERESRYGEAAAAAGAWRAVAVARAAAPAHRASATPRPSTSRPTPSPRWVATKCATPARSTPTPRLGFAVSEWGVRLCVCDRAGGACYDCSIRRDRAWVRGQ